MPTNAPQVSPCMYEEDMIEIYNVLKIARLVFLRTLTLTLFAACSSNDTSAPATSADIAAGETAVM
ncbi:MAG: hypothetical protein RL701_1238, partial [Pseudomonadota bacterium]